MIRVLAFLVCLAVLAGAAAWLADRPGDVAIVWQGYRVETSVAVALVGVVALACLVVFVWTVVRFAFRLPDVMALASRTRRRAKGFAAISRGMVAVGAGDPAAARRHAGDAERLLGREPLALLLKAQAAQITGDRAGAEAAFNHMLDTPETRVLGLRGLFVEARRKGDRAAARAYAVKAVQLAPSVGWGNEALLEYQSAERDWRGALATLERRAALRLIDKETARRQRAVLLTADALDRAEREPEAALTAAKEAAALAPDLPPASALVGEILARRGSLRKAARVLETAWRAMPHPDLATAYIDLRSGDSARDRLERAETLLRLVPGDPEGRLAVARAALAARAFGRAREALRPLLERPGVRACLLMADIEEAEHGATGAVREWLGRASRAPRDPAWIADGVVAERWSPVSPVSGRLDACVWATPRDAITAPPYEARSDEVIADADEPRALEPLPAPAAAAIPAAAPTSDPKSIARLEAPRQAEARELAAAPEPIKGNGGAADTVTPRRLATPVIFPVPHPPDDPGPRIAPERPAAFG